MLKNSIEFVSSLPPTNATYHQQGGREVEDFLKYLAKESTDGLTGFDKNGKKIKKKKSEL